MNRRALILSVLALASAGFGGAAWLATRPALTAADRLPPEKFEALARPYSPVLGPKEAPVTIVEFFDPACETCRAFHPIVKDIMEEHGAAVRLVIRYTPFHGEGSEEAIRVLEAARMQGVYEKVMEAILREQPRWASHGAPEPDLILRIAGRAGLDISEARKQMLLPDITAILNQDRADVATMGVTKTPGFFVNGRPLEPFGEEPLRRLVAAEVAATRS